MVCGVYRVQGAGSVFAFGILQPRPRPFGSFWDSISQAQLEAIKPYNLNFKLEAAIGLRFVLFGFGIEGSGHRVQD